MDDNFFAVYIVGGLVALYFGFVAMRMMDYWRLWAVRLGLAVLGGAIGMVMLPERGFDPSSSLWLGLAGGLAGAFVLAPTPKRSRHIPNGVRRQVIKNARAKGIEYDPKKHDIDHKVPFSKWGDHSVANLRVLDRSENRRRGNQDPTFWDFLR